MIKRLITVFCYIAGVLLIITWMINEETGLTFNSNKKNHISILLILLLWAAPFLLFRRSGNNDEH